MKRTDALKLAARIALEEAKPVRAKMIAEGVWSKEQQAMFAKGAKRFLLAIVSGDIAPDAASEERRQTCRQCPSMKIETVTGASGPSAWCGTPYTGSSDPPTCGCLVAAKALVASEECPQLRYRKVAPSVE